MVTEILAREMNKFNSEARCEKCGHDEISTHYQNGASKLDLACYWEKHDGEHLDRYCRRCGYGWAESVIKAND